MPAPIRNVDELGFPLPGSFDELTGQPSRPKRSWGQFFYKYRWGVLLLLLPLLFGESLINGARQFVAQRLLSNAKMEFDSDRLPEALASVNRALSWEPDSFDRWQAYSMRADIYSDSCKGMQGHLTDGLDDLNEVIKRLDDPARSRRYSLALCMAYGNRAWVLERLGRHRDAIADSTTALNIANGLSIADCQNADDSLNIDADSIVTPERMRAQFLNQRAYIRALGGTELDQAMQDVQQSLLLQPNDPDIIDTRGYVSFRLGKYDAALNDLDQAIHGLELFRRTFGFLGDNGLLRLRMRPQTEIENRKDREALAVMLHHRGEIRKKLGQEADGEGDIHRALRMGYAPDRGVY